MKHIIKSLTTLQGPSGRETEVIKYIGNEIQQYVNDMEIDEYGNLIAIKKGTVSSGQSIAFIAHADEIGLIISELKENKAHFICLTKMTYDALIGRKIRFLNGEFGVIMSNQESGKEIEHLYIDISGASKITVGMFGTFESTYEEQGDYIFAKSLDNRIGCAVLIDAVKHMDFLPVTDLYFIFSVQEELGARGAARITERIGSGYFFNIDVTSCKEGEQNVNVKMGEGCAVKIFDRGIVVKQEMIDWLREIAEKEGIKIQMEVSGRGSTDLAMLDVFSKKSLCCGISIPCKYGHNSIEIVKMSDVTEVKRIILEIMKNRL